MHVGTVCTVKGGVKVYQRGGEIVYHPSKYLTVEYQVLRRFSLSIPRWFLDLGVSPAVTLCCALVCSYRRSSPGCERDE